MAATVSLFFFFFLLYGHHRDLHVSQHSFPTRRSSDLDWPDDFQRYVEPFFGSGAVFFDLYSAGRLVERHVRLTDDNPDLVGCYRTLRDSPEAVIAALESLAEGHRGRGARFFYDVRDRRFNPTRAAGHGTYTPELAAMLIYLNRTGFNGLFRLNRRGEFNVPMGRYK